jgi:hypothetical protein
MNEINSSTPATAGTRQHSSDPRIPRGSQTYSAYKAYRFMRYCISAILARSINISDSHPHGRPSTSPIDLRTLLIGTTVLSCLRSQTPRYDSIHSQGWSQTLMTRPVTSCKIGVSCRPPTNSNLFGGTGCKSATVAINPANRQLLGVAAGWRPSSF